MAEYTKEQLRELDLLAYKLAEQLRTAGTAVSEERMRQHGGIVTEYTKLAKLWSILLGVEISEEKAIVMMAVFKANRIFCGAVDHEDHYKDGSNYFSLAWGTRRALHPVKVVKDDPEPRVTARTSNRTTPYTPRTFEEKD